MNLFIHILVGVVICCVLLIILLNSVPKKHRRDDSIVYIDAENAKGLMVGDKVMLSHGYRGPHECCIKDIMPVANNKTTVGLKVEWKPE